jgi:hypothetical protein
LIGHFDLDPWIIRANLNWVLLTDLKKSYSEAIQISFFCLAGDCYLVCNDLQW